MDKVSAEMTSVFTSGSCNMDQWPLTLESWTFWFPRYGPNFGILIHSALYTVSFYKALWTSSYTSQGIGWGNPLAGECVTIFSYLLTFLFIVTADYLKWLHIPPREDSPNQFLQMCNRLSIGLYRRKLYIKYYVIGCSGADVCLTDYDWSKTSTQINTETWDQDSYSYWGCHL